MVLNDQSFTSDISLFLSVNLFKPIFHKYFLLFYYIKSRKISIYLLNLSLQDKSFYATCCACTYNIHDGCGIVYLVNTIYCRQYVDFCRFIFNFTVFLQYIYTICINHHKFNNKCLSWLFIYGL